MDDRKGTNVYFWGTELVPSSSYSRLGKKNGHKAAIQYVLFPVYCHTEFMKVFVHKDITSLF